MNMIRFSITLLILILFLNSVASTEITWHENEDNQAAKNLPYSQNYRNQLLELEKAILSSPNPKQTLEAIATQNNMSPNELVQLIQQSKQRTASASGNTRPPFGIVLFSTLFQFLIKGGKIIHHFAQSRPRHFSLLVGFTWIIFYSIFSFPKNGIAISKHTSIFQPPHEYLERYLNELVEMNDEPMYSFSALNEDDFEKIIDFDPVIDDEQEEEEDTQDIILKGKDADEFSMKKIIHSTKQVSFALETSNNDENLNFSSFIYECASQILSSNRFTEFLPSQQRNLQSFSSKNYLLLLMKGAGAFNRFGIQPFSLLLDQEDSESKVLLFASLENGVMNALLRISIQVDECDCFITTTLFLPSSFSNKYEHVTSQLTSSIATSIAQNVQLKKRSKQFSQSYRSILRDSGLKRKQKKAKYIKELEEMARERRRRWHNPNAGHYRPSGRRMISPNHC